MAEIEMGRCEFCGRNGVSLNRKYYYYNVDCECCGAKHNGKKVHFEIRYHCSDCEPKPPREIKVVMEGRKYLANE